MEAQAYVGSGTAKQTASCHNSAFGEAAVQHCVELARPGRRGHLVDGPSMVGMEASAAGMTSFDPTHGPADNQRVEPRKRVLKGAKLVFNGGGVIDCTVLDISAKGALVLLPAPMPLPEQVALHLSGGVVYHARRRWARGQDVGFEFEENPSLSAVASAKALPFYEALRDVSPDQILAKLQAERWFDDPVLSDLAQELGAAHAALVAALRQRVTQGQAAASSAGG